MLPPPHSPGPGRHPPRLGRYAVLGELGRGGMGVVLRGRAPDGAVVAIKLSLQAWKPDSLERFERERRLLGALGAADGFVPLLDGGDSPDGPFIVMPFLAGGTLRDRLRRGPLGVEATLALGRDVARALAAAHARGIVPVCGSLRSRSPRAREETQQGMGA